MARQTNDLRLGILKLLRLRWEQNGSPLPELGELAEGVQRPPRDVRRACDALEADGYIKGAHAMGGDLKPAYWITEDGQAFLYDREHGSL